MLDIDSSMSPTYGAQEGTAYNGAIALRPQLVVIGLVAADDDLDNAGSDQT